MLTSMIGVTTVQIEIFNTYQQTNTKPIMVYLPFKSKVLTPIGNDLKIEVWVYSPFKYQALKPAEKKSVSKKKV